MDASSVLTGGVAVVVALFSFISAQRATKSLRLTETTKVDALAFERATAIYTGSIAELERRGAKCEHEVERLNSRVAVLEAVITDAGLYLPR